MKGYSADHPDESAGRGPTVPHEGLAARLAPVDVSKHQNAGVHVANTQQPSYRLDICLHGATEEVDAVEDGHD